MLCSARKFGFSHGRQDILQNTTACCVQVWHLGQPYFCLVTMEIIRTCWHVIPVSRLSYLSTFPFPIWLSSSRGTLPACLFILRPSCRAHNSLSKQQQYTSVPPCNMVKWACLHATKYDFFYSHLWKCIIFATDKTSCHSCCKWQILKPAFYVISLLNHLRH